MKAPLENDYPDLTVVEVWVSYDWPFRRSQSAVDRAIIEQNQRGWFLTEVVPVEKDSALARLLDWLLRRGKLLNLVFEKYDWWVAEVGRVL